MHNIQCACASYKTLPKRGILNQKKKKKKMLCGGNIEKWGLDWWETHEVDANYKGDSKGGEKKEKPPSVEQC